MASDPVIANQDKIIANQDRPKQIKLLRDLCDTMVNGSLCAMGGMTPFPVLSALNYYPEDFGAGAHHADHGNQQKTHV